MEIKEGIYVKEAKISGVSELMPTNREKTLLKCMVKFKIGGNTYVIKPIYRYLFKYALCELHGRHLKVIANSDSPEFLETFAITKFATKNKYGKTCEDDNIS